MARYRIIEDRECSEPACRYELTECVTVKWPWFLAGATLAIAAPVTVSAQGQYPVRTAIRSICPDGPLYAEPRLYQACFRETCPGEGCGRRPSMVVATPARAGEQEMG